MLRVIFSVTGVEYPALPRRVGRWRVIYKPTWGPRMKGRRYGVSAAERQSLAGRVTVRELFPG